MVMPPSTEAQFLLCTDVLKEEVHAPCLHGSPPPNIPHQIQCLLIKWVWLFKIGVVWFRFIENFSVRFARHKVEPPSVLTWLRLANYVLWFKQH